MSKLTKLINAFKHKEKISVSEIEESNEATLEEKINTAISKCENDKQVSLDEIEKIKKWTQDAVNLSFFVPGRFWYNEVTEYEKIKELDENKSVSDQVVKKCDEIVQGYRNQINLRESKISLCTALIEEYLKTKKKLNETEQKLSHQNDEEHKLNSLDEHINRLKNMDEDVSSLQTSFLDEQKLKVFDFDLDIAENDFKLKEEIYDQLGKLSEIYSDVKFRNNSVVFKQEIEKLIESIKKQRDTK
jgi:hypothetical protein